MPPATRPDSPLPSSDLARAHAPAFELDTRLLQRRFAGAAATLDQSAHLADEIARRMAERFDYIRHTPSSILDLGCGSGRDLQLLAQRFPGTYLHGIDFALPALQHAAKRKPVLSRLFDRARGRTQPVQVCAALDRLPFAAGSFDLVWSNLSLQWLNDPFPAFQDLHRCLAVDGLLMFSTLGPDTLKELRAALPERRGTRVHRFIDMHDIGDALVKAGFSDPVMDMEIIQLSYPDVDTLFQDLRLAGARNAGRQRPRDLGGRAEWQAARAQLEQLRTAHPDGRLMISFEVIQGHAWKPVSRTLEDGRAIVKFTPRRP